ncbi:MAG TPA: protein kinase [Polyangiaceae bacterium]
MESNENNEDSQLGLPRPFERFKLLRRIARGGMGEVYLATAGGIEGAERPVVIKIIRRDHDTDSSFLARFLDEARIQSQLHHPGVAQILEASTDASGKPYVAVEYVEGRNLSDVRSRAAHLGVRIEWPEAVALAITIGDALAHVHERTDADGRPLEIVHRDLSPQNVMVGYGGDLKLIDFGTARGENRRCHTISGVVFAKPGYVAPEVANNTPGGAPADLYAFGVILWELLVGRRFLVGEPAVHLAAVGAGKKSPTPIAQAIGASPELDAVIQRLTAARVEERYARARQATADLVRVLQRAPSLADGDRSVRGRIAHLMRRLYPAEPARSRAEFQSLVSKVRASKNLLPAIPDSPPPPAPEEKMLPGTRYRIEKELGQGATGVVYEAVHVDLGRRVALKVLHEECAGGATRGRFVAEARAVARVSHEGLVMLHEFGFTSEGRPFYAMELVAGEALDCRLARQGTFAWRDAVGVAIKACRAVEAAHEAGLVHRDIKPGNLMLLPEGGVKLLDFGVAKPESELESSEDREGGALVVVGTPEYMAPEQARGAADARSDVYGLAAVLYELCTGLPPHQASSAVALIEQKLAGPPAPASSIAPDHDLPRALDRVLTRALAPAPADRFASVAALRSALEPLVDERARARKLRRRAGVALIGAVTTAAVAVFGARASQTVPDGLVAAVGIGRELVGQALGVGLLEASALAKAPAVPAEPARDQPAPPIGAEPAAAEAPLPAEPSTPTFGEDTESEAELAAKDEAAPEDSAPAEPESDETTAPSEATAVAVAEVPALEGPAGKALAEFEQLEKDGRPLKALHLIRAAVRQSPGEPRLLRAYVKAAEGSKAWGEARRAAERWVKLEATSESRLSLARLERATGNLQKAVRLVESVLKDDPSSEDARRLQGAWSHEQRFALNR